MTNEQEKRLEEIRNHFTSYGHCHEGDIFWLLTLIDEQRGEIEELKQMLQRWETDPLTELTDANAKVERLRKALLDDHVQNNLFRLGALASSGIKQALADTEDKGWNN